jgi:PKD repeat protein
MKFLSKLILFLTLLSSAAFAGTVTVTCTAPTNNSTVGTSVPFNCSASTTGGSITGWHIYQGGLDMWASTTNGPTQSPTVTLNIGTNTAVVVKAWDSQGAVGQLSLTLTVAAPQVTVSIGSPAPGASVNSPVTLTATATTLTGAVDGWHIYDQSASSVDLWSTPGPTSSITASLTFTTTGNHTLLVRAWNGAGSFGDTTITVNVACVTNCGNPTPAPPPSALSYTSSVTAETKNNTSASDKWQGLYYNLGFGRGTNVAKAANTSTVSIHTLLYSGHSTLIFTHDTPWFVSGDDYSHKVTSDSVQTLSTCSVFASYPQSGASANGFQSCQSHLDIGVSDELSYQAQRKVNDERQRGLDGVFTDWYGKGDNTDFASLRYRDIADALGFRADGVTPVFAVSPQIDSGVFTTCKGSPTTSNCKDISSLMGGTELTNATGQSTDNAGCASLTLQTQSTYTGSYTVTTDKATCFLSKMIVTELYYLKQTYWTHTSALKINGRPIISFFSPDIMSYTDGGGASKNVKIDWKYIQSFDTQLLNPQYLFRETGGFKHDTTYGGHSEGAFSWIGLDSTPFDTNYDEVVSYVNNFYNSHKTSYPSKIAMGSAWSAFNNRAASWACGTYPNCEQALGNGTGNFKITAALCGSTFIDSTLAVNTYYSSSFQLPLLTQNTWTDYEEGSAVQPGIDNCWNVSTPTIDGAKVLHWTLAGADPDGAGTYSSGGPDSAALASLKTVDHFTVFVSDGTAAADGSERLAILADNLAVTEDTAGCGCFSLKLSNYNIPSGTYHVYVKLQSKPFIHNSWTTSFVSYTAVSAANISPTAGLIVSPGSGPVPLTVTADTSGSTDPDGSITKRDINWGDGSAHTILTGSNTSATHTYSAVQSYTVTLTVTDNSNATASTTATVGTTAAGAASATITVNPASGNPPLTVIADTNGSQPSTGATISTRVISWGDGSPNTSLSGAVAQAQHTYNSGGTFTVTVTVTDTASKTAQATKSVSVVTSSTANGSITIDTLSDQSFVFSPVRVHATATAISGPVTRMQIYVDNALVFDQQSLSANPAVLDKYVFLSVGAWHSVRVQAFDAIGVTFYQSVTVFAEGTNQ